MKEQLAKEIASRVHTGQVIGVGTGTTVDLAVQAIGRRVKNEGLSVRVVPTSYQTGWLCSSLGLEVLAPGCADTIDWGFDGADYIEDPGMLIIKGKGGAMLKEKIMAARCNHYVIVADESKLAARLGASTPIPVEVVPEALAPAEAGIQKLGALTITLRNGQGKHGPVITEAGNVILDVEFEKVTVDLESAIKSVVGVVESGLFAGYATEVLIAGAGQMRTLIPRPV